LSRMSVLYFAAVGISPSTQVAGAVQTMRAS
jgi:hypothetical protein